MAKRFFLVCLGVLCLAIAYHLGAERAQAQGSTGHLKLIACDGDVAWVVTDTDDIYLLNGKGLSAVSKGDGWAKYRVGLFK